eukprot:3004757-Rhodomonas_salina.1
MEFDRVMLSADFSGRVPMIGETLIPRMEINASIVEELNVLYVAVTRARCVLQVPDRVFKYFELLRLQEPEVQGGGVSEGEWMQLRDEVHEAWRHFSATFTCDVPVSLSEIPMPSEKLFDAGNVEFGLLREFAHWMYRQYHEDKFFSRFSVREHEKAAIQERLTFWFQQSHTLLSGGTEEEF